MIDADGKNLGLYRKTHIPQGPGYEEKDYFSPGDTGYTVWDTGVGRIGLAICRDQCFPECARAMALIGAEILLYPAAIGSEPPNPGYDSQPHRQACMTGHAGANIMPALASDRIGYEVAPGGRDLTFHGSRFMADHAGQVAAKASRDQEEVITATFDMDQTADLRQLGLVPRPAARNLPRHRHFGWQRLRFTGQPTRDHRPV